MLSVAAVLFTKNDVSDIDWWISYHLACGFDRLIVIDDHSQDGLWELLTRAKKIFPIDLYRAESQANERLTRRFDAYTFAIKHHGERFDWFGFFEGDEYFLPVQDQTVHQFLARFPQADAIAVPWSIYGANGHERIPRDPPIIAFTRRAPACFSANRFFSNFVRPRAFTGEFPDPFRWKIDGDRYYSASGRMLDSTTDDTLPDWSHARILHYISRSVQQFRDRTSRIKETIDHDAYWRYFDRNEIEDPIAAPFISQTRAWARKLADVLFIEYFWILQAEEQAAATSHPCANRWETESGKGDHLTFSEIRNSLGHRLVYDPDGTGLAFKPRGEIAREELSLCYFVATHGAKEGSTGLLACHGADLSSLIGSTFPYPWVPLFAKRVKSSQSVEAVDHYLLTCPLTGKRLSPSEHGSLTLSTSSLYPFRLVEAAPPSDLAAALYPFAVLSHRGFGLDTFRRGVRRSAYPSPAAMAFVIAHMSSDEQEKLAASFPCQLPAWIKADEPR